MTDKPRVMIRDASFANVDFRRFNFNGAWIADCNFQDCDLRGADFRGALVTGCHFFNCKMKGAKHGNGSEWRQNIFDGTTKFAEAFPKLKVFDIVSGQMVPIGKCRGLK